MAKMFYTADEVKTMLGLDDEALRVVVQEGKLRELHDGPRRVFKVEEVDALASQAPAKPGGLDSADASSFSLEMADSTAGGASATGRADTALGAADRSADQVSLGDTEAPVKPIAEGVDSGEGVLQLDGSGSGSGLLDLTREGDDTSLGAVLDEIYPTEDETAAGGTGLGSGIAAGLGTGLASALTSDEGEAPIDQGIAVDAGQLAADRMAKAARPFTAGMILAVALLGLALSAVVAVLQGMMPGYLSFICDNLLYFTLGSAVAAGVLFVLGAVLSR